VGSLPNATNITGNVSGNITATMGSIGAITITADGTTTPGNLTGSVISEQNIGNVSVAGSISGTLKAGDTTVNGFGQIGTVTANQLTGTIQSQSKDNTDSIGAVTLSNGITNGSILSGGVLNALTIKAGGDTGSVTVGSLPNATNITGNVSGNITATRGSIGAIQVFGDITSGTIKAATTIGNIVGSGINNQSVTVNAGTTMGNVTFNGLANGNQLSLNESGATSIGNIVVNNSSAGFTDNLVLTGDGKLTSIGGINVDGQLDVTNAKLLNLNAMNGPLSANSLKITGSSAIQIGGSSSGGGIGGNYSINVQNATTIGSKNVTFNVSSYTGVVTIGNSIIPVPALNGTSSTPNGTNIFIHTV
jgi:hypothetical protein